MPGKPDVVVVGAGVMGCSAAYWLREEGYKVLTLEKEAVAAGASGMSAVHWLAVGRGAREVLQDGWLTELGWLSCKADSIDRQKSGLK